MANITILDTTYNETLKIAICEQLQQEIETEISDLHHSNVLTRHQSYLNLLVRKSFLGWLNLMLETEFSDDYSLLEQVSIWEFINGNTIEIGESRFVLIPMETEDKSEFTIAEEWLKLNDFVGSYYLPVGVNLNDNYLDFWGYITYDDLLHHGQLDMVNHHFDIPCEELETDLNLIALEYEYEWKKSPSLGALSPLGLNRKQQLIEQAKKELFPRYSLDFAKWLYVMDDSKMRQELFVDRQPISLTQWLNQKIESTLINQWQNAENLMKELFLPPENWQPSFSSARRRLLSLDETLGVLIDNPNIDLARFNSLVNSIPNLIFDDEQKTKAIAILVDLLDNTADEEQRWTLSICLNQLNAKHPNIGQWYCKPIVFEEDKINLLLGILPKSIDEISIFIRVCGEQANQSLPDNLRLQIIDESDNLYQEIIADRNDKAIQYKFWGNKEEQFTLKIISDHNEYSQKFMV